MRATVYEDSSHLYRMLPLSIVQTYLYINPSLDAQLCRATSHLRVKRERLLIISHSSCRSIECSPEGPPSTG